MTLTISGTDSDTLANALAVAADAGAGPGKVRIYSGARPANPGVAISTQTLLAEFTLNDPAYAAASGGTGVATMDVDPVPATTGLAAGTATWARLLDSNNTARYDGKCSTSGGGGDFILNTTTISVGLALELISGTLTQPLGTAD
ncbi:MAG TPA: hypothetical protein VFY84_19155 [Jiangellales bacterium]|nr:hypothetical protein [Jiangellales bacterium]